MSLVDSISSNYIAAANKMKPKKARQRIVAYVESYDDILFWSNVLSPLETPKRYFEIMLPTGNNNELSRGKRSAIRSALAANAGECMIACVDADYDYLMGNHSELYSIMLTNPYVFHTYAYAIENLLCYAPALYNVCVMATLNNRRIFQFERFFQRFSEIIYPLFLISVWAYHTGNHNAFPISNFNNTILLRTVDLEHPQDTLQRLDRKVRQKCAMLRRKFPTVADEMPLLKQELAELGVTPQTTYLYIQGHHLQNAIVEPLLNRICWILRSERQREINSLSLHEAQRQSEMGSYEHSSVDCRTMLRKNTGYIQSPIFQQIQNDIRSRLG